MSTFFKFLLVFMEQQLQLIGILVLRLVHALVYVQFKHFNGSEPNKIFLQQTVWMQPLKVLV